MRLWGLCSFIAKLSQCCTTARTRLLIPGDVIPPGPRFSLVAACVPVWGLSQWCSQGCSVPFDTELHFLMTKRKFFQYNACCICQQELKDGCKAQLDVADCILFLKAGSSLRSWPWTRPWSPALPEEPESLLLSSSTSASLPHLTASLFTSSVPK